MPPRMATTAPNTAPAKSPHLLLQQPMVVCVSLLPSVHPSVCLAACSPSVSVFVVCASMCSLPVYQEQQQPYTQAVLSEELTEQQRPGEGTHTSGRCQINEVI